MIECPTCGNTAFTISSDTVKGVESDEAHLITCTKCRLSFTLEIVEDEEVRSDLETEEAGKDEGEGQPELGGKGGLVRH